MAFDTRNKCRICGMTCDFPGQVYCRSCLNKKRKQEELKERVELKCERELRNEGSKISLNRNDTILLIKTFSIAFIIIFVISFFLYANRIKSNDSTRVASIANNGKIIYVLEGTWDVVGYVDFFEVLSMGGFESENDWQKAIPDEMLQAKSGMEISVSGRTLKTSGVSYVIKALGNNVFSFSSKNFDGGGLICLADDDTLHEYVGGELFIYKRH